MSEELPKSNSVASREVVYTGVVTTNGTIAVSDAIAIGSAEVRREYFRRAAIPPLLWRVPVGPQLTSGAWIIEDMFERFTDRARRVMKLANQESQRFNHEYIGTEHILIGLVKEGSGVAANVLKNLGVDLGKIRLEVERIAHHGPGGGDAVRLPLTPLAHDVVRKSAVEADLLEHSYVGTEHLLLAMLRRTDCVATRAMEALGVTADRVRFEIMMLLGVKVKHEADTPQVIE